MLERSSDSSLKNSVQWWGTCSACAMPPSSRLSTARCPLCERANWRSRLAVIRRTRSWWGLSRLSSIRSLTPASTSAPTKDCRCHIRALGTGWDDASGRDGSHSILKCACCPEHRILLTKQKQLSARTWLAACGIIGRCLKQCRTDNEALEVVWPQIVQLFQGLHSLEV